MRAEFANIAAGFAMLPALSAGVANCAVVINAGGTGLVTTTGTLALAGNLATTGAFNTTLAQQASVTLTLPAVSGTLATLAGAETLSNKVAIGAGVIYATNNILAGTTTNPNNGIIAAVAASTSCFTAQNSSSGAFQYVAVYTGATGSNNFAGFFYNGSQVGGITSSGSTTAYNTTSDETLKANWRVLARDEVRTRINGLFVGEHDWIKSPEIGRAMNFKAQQGHKIHPQAFQPANDKTPWMRSVGEMEPLLTLGLQHAFAELDDKEIRIAALEKELAELKRAP